MFLYLSQPKFRGEVVCTTQPPGSANTLRHKRGRTPNFTLQALPWLCSIRGPGARQQPAGPRRAAGGDGSGGNRRHDPPSPRKPAPTAGPTQRGGCGSGRAAGPQSRGGRSPRAIGANKKTPKTKPQLKPPTKQTEKGNHHRDPRSREKRSREARSLSAILEA